MDDLPGLSDARAPAAFPAGPAANGGTVPDAVEIRMPQAWTLPIVLASPHSGRHYPPDFVAASRLSATALRLSEDAYVDEIFGGAVALGAPLITATFPRAYVDPNREPFELDPDMFAERLPDYVNTRSPRVQVGLGTIPRVVAGGAEIYRGPLRFAEALERVERCYRPYHAALTRLVSEARGRFGACLLLDCHSMPSAGAHAESGGHGRRARAAGQVDMVLGDCHGQACAPHVMAAAERCLREQGYQVVRNSPYAGGFTTRHYGRPETGLHALQIEINRSLYMDESDLSRRSYIDTLARHMERLVAALGRLPVADLAA
jgi:N-formylglutamate amidohydrolase